MEKGVRVEIVRSKKGQGVFGTVFWTGEDRFNEGEMRLGVRGDDGETYWVSESQVEKTDAAPPSHEEPELSKGDVVSWTRGEEELQGEVFWLGPSKHGGGTRVGVRDGSGETHWIDAHHLTLLSQGGAVAAEEADEEPPF
ncbi:MAG: hypothetical protein R3F59_18860 [Myxococcota bacterium]